MIGNEKLIREQIMELDEDTIQVLKEWKERQSKMGFDDFVFSYEGMPMIKSTIARIIQRLSKLAKVHRNQAKGLRHSYASYLINEFNISVLILSKRMGHSSPESRWTYSGAGCARLNGRKVGVFLYIPLKRFN